MLLEEYKSQDTYQQMNSRSFLETLKSKSRGGEDDVRQYIRQYTAISAVLIEKGQLESYTRGVWFLNRLPGDVRGKVIRKNRVNIDQPDTLVFENLARTATEIYTSNKTVREFADDRKRQEGLSDLVDKLGYTASIREHENRLTAPVIAPRGGLGGESIDELTKAFDALALSARAAALANSSIGQQGGFNLPGGGNPVGTYPTGPTGRINASAPPQGQRMLRVNYPAGNNAAAAQYARPTYCFYCLEDGHFRSGCPDFLIDIKRGLVHDDQGRLYLGRAGGRGQPVPMRRGEKGSAIVRSHWDKAQPSSGQAGPSNRPVVLPRGAALPNVGVSAILVADVFDSDTEEGSEEGMVMVAGAQGEFKQISEEKWQNPKKILRERAARERKLAVPRLPRVGE